MSKGFPRSNFRDALADASCWCRCLKFSANYRQGVLRRFVSSGHRPFIRFPCLHQAFSCLLPQTTSPRSNSAVPLHSKGQLVVFEASLADSLLDHLAEDKNDNDNDEENDDGEGWYSYLGCVASLGVLRFFVSQKPTAVLFARALFVFFLC